MRDEPQWPSPASMCCHGASKEPRRLAVEVTGQGAAIDTTTATSKLVFGIFADLAEVERALTSERIEVGRKVLTQRR